MSGPYPPDLARSGVLTPTPEKQLAFIGLTFGVGALYARPGWVIRGYKYGVGSFVAAQEMSAVYPALGPDYQVGIRYGGTGEMSTVGRSLPPLRMYGPALSNLPFPDFGFGLTAVPAVEDRLVPAWADPKVMSRGGQGSSLPSIPGAANGTSIPSPSATASGARLRGRGSPRFSGGRDAAPYCRVHKKRHWCKFTRKNK